MSYLLIRVHSFACDYPLCSAEEEHAERRKKDAWKILRNQGWRLVGGCYFCPGHAGIAYEGQS